MFFTENALSIYIERNKDQTQTYLLALCVSPPKACKKPIKIQLHYSLVIQCPNKIRIPLLK